jgi:hypothetical protein
MTAPVWQAHNPNTGKNCDPEAYGASGDKEPMPADYPSMASDDGNHDVSAQVADAKFHKNPTVALYPDNMAGPNMAPAAGDSGNPTAAEGATGPVEY